MSEGILDLRFAICDWGASRCRDSRSSHNRGQVAGFPVQRGHLASFQEPAVNNQLHPVGRFIHFFFHGAEFRNKLRFGLTPTRGSIVGSDRHSASYQLGSNSTAFSRPGQRTNQFQYPQGEMLCSLLQFSFVHTCEIRNQMTKSQIANLK
jgi:hypothetical protein